VCSLRTPYSRSKGSCGLLVHGCGDGSRRRVLLLEVSTGSITRTAMGLHTVGLEGCKEEIIVSSL
jgi:hypothetical protein